MLKTSPTHRAARGAMRGLSAFLPVFLFLACGGLPEPADEPGAITGELTVHIFNLGERSEILHTLKLSGGEQRELRFESPPELVSGSTLRVFGADDGRAIAVSRFEVIGDEAGGPLERKQRALIEGVQKPPKKWAFVLVDTGGGVNVTKQAAMDRLFSDRPDSIRSYYREVSYGLQELSGDIVGPLSFTPPAGGLCQNFSMAAQALLPMIQGTYNQYLWYFGSRIANCPWGGVAQLGAAARPTQHSFYNASAQCVVLVQEPGHNFGMVHSSSLRCTRAGAGASMIADATDGQCTHNEYGNPFDPMGGGGGTGSMQMLNRCFHMNGVQKSYQDWLGGCNIVRADTSGTYTIYPLEKACNGVQVLQVPLVTRRTLNFPPSPGATLQTGVITSYYVEMRSPVGLDAGLQTPRVFIVAAGDSARRALARQPQLAHRRHAGDHLGERRRAGGRQDLQRPGCRRAEDHGRVGRRHQGGRPGPARHRWLSRDARQRDLQRRPALHRAWPLGVPRQPGRPAPRPHARRRRSRHHPPTGAVDRRRSRSRAQPRHRSDGPPQHRRRPPANRRRLRLPSRRRRRDRISGRASDRAPASARSATTTLTPSVAAPGSGGRARGGASWW